MSAVPDPEYVFVDPTRVSLVLRPPSLGSKIVEQVLGKTSTSTVLDGQWDLALPDRFPELDSYQAIRGHLLHDIPWQETHFYRRVVREINAGMQKWGCREPSQFERRLNEHVSGLYQAIAAEGYRTQRELGSDNPGDEIRLAIDRKGRLLFLDGRHRLSIARVLGLSRVPARVVIRHSRWAEFRNEIIKHAQTTKRQMIYQRIDHPDLEHIPAHHHDRSSFLQEALDGYDCRNKRLLDIGSHWGHMCHRLEDMGFICTAVEKLESNVYFMDRIRVACSKRFGIWSGDIFSYPALHHFDVVVALNIFHHFLKTEDLHSKLIHLLQRMKPELMIFQAHKSDPPGQMEGAYRNYGSDEFVAFVSEHSGLPHWKELGIAPDGRPIFKLWK